ncbi:MAG: tyrosine-type recombinase/integrase [Bacillota bacterium]
MIVKFAVREFIADREFANLSSYTLKTYRRVLEDFDRHCVENGIVSVTDVDKSVIRSYLNYCRRDLNNVPSTLNQKLRVLKAFINYLKAEEIYDSESNPFKNVKFAKVETRIETLNDKHLRQILRYFDRMARHKPFHAYRNRMIIITLLSTGMRRGELVNLRWSDIDFENNVVTVYGKKRQSASIPITSKLRKELSDFYMYVKSVYDSKPSKYVFSNSAKGQLKPDSVSMIFKRMKKIFGWDDVRLSSHTFRHTFSSRALKSGMDPITLQRILRHESLQMTERYVNMWGSALKDQNDKHNPLNKFDF